jgi:AraC-like DNA-binding protein
MEGSPMASRRIAHYVLRDDALTWLVGSRTEWQRKDGTPSIEAVARAAGIHPPTLSRILNHTRPLNANVMASLIWIAGTSHDEAVRHMFNLVPDQSMTRRDLRAADERLFGADHRRAA